MNENISTCLQDILSEAFTHREKIKHPGLIGGKTGLCMNMYRLSRETKDIRMESNADMLIEEIMDQVNLQMPIFFAFGSTGIGWAIETLAREAYIEADTDFILKDLDKLMTTVSGYTMTNDCSFIRGYVGRGFYTLLRLSTPVHSDDELNVLYNKGLLVNYIGMLQKALVKNPEKLLLTEIAGGSKYWDCPCILAFLAEAFRANVFNHGVKQCLKIIADRLRGHRFEQEVSTLYILPALKDLIDLNGYSPLEEVYQTLLHGVDLKKLRSELNFENATLSSQLELTLLYSSLKTIHSGCMEQYMDMKDRLEKNVSAYLGQPKPLLERLSNLDLLDGYNGYFIKE